MWPVYLVMTWFVLALVVPAGWASWKVWRRARVSRELACPVTGAPALVKLDPWYAVKMHARGNRELRVMDCACWPERRDCGQECLERAGRAA
jgi:hypothetical protein